MPDCVRRVIPLQIDDSESRRGDKPHRRRRLGEVWNIGSARCRTGVYDGRPTQRLPSIPAGDGRVFPVTNSTQQEVNGFFDWKRESLHLRREV